MLPGGNPTCGGSGNTPVSPPQGTDGGSGEIPHNGGGGGGLYLAGGNSVQVMLEMVVTEQQVR